MQLQAPKAKPQKKYPTDIVFCIDMTGSMKPCIDNIKNNLDRFLEELKRGYIDFRLALIGYRDCHDTTINPDLGVPVCEEPWFISPGFTSNPETFRNWLYQDICVAFGGGKQEPESTLDALYIALTMQGWRSSGSHRVIVLFTDSDTRPTLAPKTYNRKDNDVNRVIQELSTKMKHGILYLCAPRSPIYDKIQRNGNAAGRMVIMKAVSGADGLKDIDFAKLLESIGKTISASAPSVKQHREK